MELAKGDARIQREATTPHDRAHQMQGLVEQIEKAFAELNLIIH